MMLERLRDLVEQAWDYRMEHMWGFYSLPQAEQWMVLKAREPLFLLGPDGVIMGPWLAQLASISSRETAKLLTTYRHLQTLFEAQDA